MRFGMQSYRMEDDLVQEDVVVSDPEVQADAQEAQANIEEVVQLCDAIETFNEAAGDLQLLENEHKVQVQVMDGDYAVTNGEIKVMEEDDVTINVDAKELGEAVGNDAGEVLTPESTDVDADEAAAKLERDLSGILTKVQGSLFTSKFARSAIGRKESDFKLTGKRGYRAKVEGISEVGKKVWEHIKAFFAKIWEFMKSLFERFTALFKSNKSVLEGLKAKLEKEEDSKYDSIKKDAKESQQLTFFHRFGKEYVNNVSKFVEQYASDMEKFVEALKSGEIPKNQSKHKKSIIDVIALSDGDLEGLNKVENFCGFGVNGEGVVGVALTIKPDVFKYESKTFKFKKGSFEKEKNLRDVLIEICEYGIDLCTELDGSFIKDSEKIFNDAKKEAEEIINDMYDRNSDDDAKKSDAAKSAQKNLTKVLTAGVSTFSKIVATVGQQPSQIVSAVRNGMSMCEPAKK